MQQEEKQQHERVEINENIKTSETSGLAN